MMSNTFYTDNSAVLGLFSNIIITSDSKRLCFINLNANNFFVLNIRPVDYDFSGNILIIKNISETIVSQIEVLISKGVVYKLFDHPIKISDNKLHNIPIENILENKAVLSTLFLVTIVLDTIPELPTLFYPPIKGIKCRTFSGASLRMNDIRSIIPQLQGCKKIRLLGKDIFKHDFIHLPEFNDIKLETIVDYQYYVSHIDEIENLNRQFSIIVDIKDISAFDDNRCSNLNNENVSVTFYCQLHNKEELNALGNMRTDVKPYPSNAISRQLTHFFLDYSEEELNQMRITRTKLFLNKVINTNFYGNVIIDNEGNINSYPFSDYLINRHCSISRVIAEIKQNSYWYLTREKFFKKCSDCVFSAICPPLSNYEINSEEIFCPYQQTAD